MAGPSFLLPCSEPASFMVSILSPEHFALFQAMSSFNHYTKPMSRHYHHFTDGLTVLISFPVLQLRGDHYFSSLSTEMALETSAGEKERDWLVDLDGSHLACLALFPRGM